jgi:hypothetical protein
MADAAVQTNDVSPRRRGRRVVNDSDDMKDKAALAAMAMMDDSGGANGPNDSFYKSRDNPDQTLVKFYLIFYRQLTSVYSFVDFVYYFFCPLFQNHHKQIFSRIFKRQYSKGSRMETATPGTRLLLWRPINR